MEDWSRGYQSLQGRILLLANWGAARELRSCLSTNFLWRKKKKQSNMRICSRTEPAEEERAAARLKVGKIKKTWGALVNWRAAANWGGADARKLRSCNLKREREREREILAPTEEELLANCGASGERWRLWSCWQIWDLYTSTYVHGGEQRVNDKWTGSQYMARFLQFPSTAPNPNTSNATTKVLFATFAATLTATNHSTLTAKASKSNAYSFLSRWPWRLYTRAHTNH
jgi:hypothetical protein